MRWLVQRTRDTMKRTKRKLFRIIIKEVEKNDMITYNQQLAKEYKGYELDQIAVQYAEEKVLG